MRRTPTMSKPKGANLFVLDGQEDDLDPMGWDDMPEFEQENREDYAALVIRFRTEEDLKEFAQKIGQPNLTKKSRGTFYPAVEFNEANLLRWMDEEQIPS